MSSIKKFQDSISKIIEYSFGESRKVQDLENFPQEESYVAAVSKWNKLRESYVSLKYWSDWDNEIPNLHNSDHMTVFLYLLAREEAASGKIQSADRLSYLNRIRNGIDLWHTVTLPNRFFVVHPIGTVLGRAIYADKLVFYQNVTIGSSNNHYPTFKGSCLIYSGASILGNSLIGENVVIGAGTLLIDQEIPPNSMVFGTPGNLKIRPLEYKCSKAFFK